MQKPSMTTDKAMGSETKTGPSSVGLTVMRAVCLLVRLRKNASADSKGLSRTSNYEPEEGNHITEHAVFSTIRT